MAGNRIVFVPTWRCQNRCFYCDYDQKGKPDRVSLKCFGREYDIGSELTWGEWLVMLNRFRPYHLEMTGGEPTLWKGFYDLVAHIPSGSTWGITSNTEFCDPDRIPVDRNKGWTASYHFRQLKPFMRKVTALRNMGFHVNITMVAHPKTMKNIEKSINEFVGFPVNIHPFLGKGFNWADHPEDWKRVKEFMSLCTNETTDIPIPPSWEISRYAECNAGIEYFMLWPDGRVAPCYSSILRGEFIGQFVDWKGQQERRPCGKECIFPCDKINVLKWGQTEGPGMVK